VYRTRIKVCGITRHSDALAAIAAGVDAIGLVFYPNSPRAVSVAQAEQILLGLPPLVTVVGLFVDAQPELVQEACQQLPLGLLQFHGAESQAYCDSFGLPWMKALRVAPESDVQAMMAGYSQANAILLDTYKEGQPGGTGERFDWGKVPAGAAQPIVLAGGLRPDNVGAAVAQCQPYAVDVSGGVESAPGQKDLEKLAEFVAAVSAADRNNGRSR
jgi:phosphoribosylanthranilate isomerase